MKKLVAFSLLGLCCLVLAPQAWAESVTRQLPFSTKVTLVVPKTYLFKMELCTDAACTETAYAETQKIVLRTATLSFKLGAGTVDPTSPAFSEVDFSQQYWLRISRSTATGFVALGPPSKLNVVPYALWSNQVEGVGAGVGTITGVYGGDGLTGSATNGAATLNVGAGSGIAVGADSISIANAGVTSAHIADSAVTSADIADGAVTGADIADNSITASDIATGGVGDLEIADGSVSSADIADNSITAADIATGGVGSAEIADGAVTSGDIADGAVASADIATGGVTSANILDGTVTSTDVGFNYAGSSSKGGVATSAADSDLVDGLHANRLRPILALDYNPSTTTLATASCTHHSGSSVSITVPSGGTIVVEFDLFLYLNHAAGTSDYGWFMVSTDTATCTNNGYNAAYAYAGSQLPTGGYDYQLHATRAYSVSAGTYTYYLNGDMGGGWGDDQMLYATMKAVFYPN